MHDLLGLYRFALRSGNRPLTRALARLVRSEAVLCRQADRHLQELPRGTPRGSPAGERVVRRVLERLARSRS